MKAFFFPTKAQTNINKVDFGKWKLVSKISTVLNLQGGKIKISVLDFVLATKPFSPAGIKRLFLKFCVQKKQILKQVQDDN
ncbi:MAG: hypothetical protein A3D15_05355 [Alphaproteobacteria bacterium RIFCSPHIGHO2_02_FULL_40_34]|nr:MAG: hypothetical protein A3D15_05355 [Alphaproteobacteria bacterium RIFCSPHIGHO2_02_FULL_40_34]OFX09888.1 MAG: hypothetical protein A3H30_06055 [Alphaproteobacteria bacterium RIFCSPLOWO2_02_FULL_40_19]OFX10937.1 MAG: hypothetical protein A3G22_02205 [Alphaproteobacteria bacterium RIFCSPLOWO2_12_FULL_40_11]